MSRLQKKCFIGATGMHCLLLLALVVGPGFFNRQVVDDAPVLEFIPIVATDENLKGGGSPRPAANNPTPPQPVVQQPQPAPPPPEPKDQPVEKVEKTEKIEPEKPQPEKNTRPDRDAPVVSKEKEKTKKREVTVSTTRVKIPRTTTTTTAKNSSTTATASNTSSEFARAVSNAGRRVSSGLSSATQVDLPEGPGGGGVSYANYGQIVRKIYTDAWRVPDDMSDDEASIKVSVTIARDGTVLSSRITQTSGSTAADRSIQATLDRITNIGVAFPSGAKEAQRTFILTFNLKAKKAFG